VASNRNPIGIQSESGWNPLGVRLDSRALALALALCRHRRRRGAGRAVKKSEATENSLSASGGSVGIRGVGSHELGVEARCATRAHAELSTKREAPGARALEHPSRR